jgi:hypothetical protein
MFEWLDTARCVIIISHLFMPLHKKYVMANTKRRSIISSKKGGAKQY